MPIDQALANSVLATARGFYKGQQKSDNKRYGAGHNQPNHLQRNANQGAAVGQIRSNRQYFRQHSMSFIGIGSSAWAHGIRSGNCLEMASVTSYLCTTMLPPPYGLFIGRLSPPGDHVFVMISANGALPAGNTIGELATNQQSDLFYVIDPWTNIACRVADYPHRLTTKFGSWSDQGKEVWGAGQWHDPASNAYSQAFLNSPIRWEVALNQP
jgi:hypothetical protein